MFCDFLLQNIEYGKTQTRFSYTSGLETEEQLIKLMKNKICFDL